MGEEREEEDILSMLCELGELACSLDSNIAVQLNSLAVLAFVVRARDARDIESALAVCRLSVLTSRSLLAGIRTLHLEYLRKFLSDEACTAIPEASGGSVSVATGGLFAGGPAAADPMSRCDTDLLPG
ncbi:MAG: hypothetical protein ACYC92_06785 [Candidatus Acidiferrales bacterium]